jgi:2-methylisocitrate lyase-like PEP mutase family enzyme
MAAAAETARSVGVPFVLTGRTENFLRERPDLDDTIRRLQAYEKAGADVLFAPGLPDLAAVKQVCSALTKPFSFMVGIKGKSFSVAELEAAGVKRISLATSLYRAAMKAARDAAQEAMQQGTFTYLDRM